MIVAIVNDNKVTEIKTINDADYSSLSCQIAIDITNANPMPQVGWAFDGSKLVGVATSTKITRLAMKNRFLDSEYINILKYMDNTANAFCYQVKMLMSKIDSATYIDLQRTDTAQGVVLLVYVGLLTAERANAILTAPPTDLEVYRG